MPYDERLIDIVYGSESLYRQKGTLAMEIQIRRSMGVKNMQQEIKMASECMCSSHSPGHPMGN
jgi:hypothetical protein